MFKRIEICINQRRIESVQPNMVILAWLPFEFCQFVGQLRTATHGHPRCVAIHHGRAWREYRCAGTQANPITQVNTKAWRNALKRAGIEDFRWHDLRHTFATWHREAGTPTCELQGLGGWKTQSMVERYAHVAPEGLQVAARRLDVLLRDNGAELGRVPGALVLTRRRHFRSGEL